jgi:hypothetical protein
MKTIRGRHRRRGRCDCEQRNPAAALAVAELLDIEAARPCPFLPGPDRPEQVAVCVRQRVAESHVVVVKWKCDVKLER